MGRPDSNHRAIALPLASTLALALASTLAATTPARAETKAAPAAEWPRWRGPDDRGSVGAGPFPDRLSPETTSWKTPLPGKGCSTPIVWRDRIILTAPIEGRDAVLAFDRRGQPLWKTPLGEENPGKHRNGSGSNPSPSTDGERAFVHFKSGTLAALSPEGRVLWQTNIVEAYGRDTLYWDHGTSPVVVDSQVVMARMHHGSSWIAAFDAATGALRWKVDRNYETPTEGDHGYTTPLVIRHQGRKAILLWGAQHVTVHDPADGRTLWSCGGFNPQNKSFWPAVASPVVVGDFAIVPFGRADRTEPRLHGIRLGGSGDVTATHRAWMRDDIGTFVPTPAANATHAFILRDRGEIEAIDPASGKSQWKDAFPRASANFYASPLVAGDLLYAIREDGRAFVANVADGFRLVSETDLGERVIASPVAVGREILVRGEKHLHCFTIAKATP